MPPSIASNHSSSGRPSSTLLARKSGKPSSSTSTRATIIEISDTSSEDEATFGRASRTAGRSSTAGAANTSNAAAGPSGSARISVTRTSSTARNNVAVDSSDTDESDEDDVEDRRPRRHAASSAVATRASTAANAMSAFDRLRQLVADNDNSTALARAPVASSSTSTSREAAIKRSRREDRAPSTSATEESSADDAPVVASSASRSARPAQNAINGFSRPGSPQSGARPFPFASNGRSSTVNAAASGSMPVSTRRATKAKARADVESQEEDELDGDAASGSESESDSASTVVTHGLEHPLRSSRRKMSSKRKQEPEVTVTSIKRSRAATNTAGPSTSASTTVSSRTRKAGTSSGLVRTGSANSLTNRSPALDGKGKGRAPRSSVEPASAKKNKTATFGGIKDPSSQLGNGSYPTWDQLAPFLSSQKAHIHSESMKVDYPGGSKIVTKVVLKPTDLSEELECAICSEIMVSPVNLACGHTFCEACVVPWLDTSKDCPSCRMKTEAEPVRSYLIDRLIKKYLESTWAYLESEGKHEEAQASREERTKNEKEAETRRMQAAQEKNRRAAAAAAALAERQGGANRMFQVQAARAGAVGMPLQMPAQRARLVAAARGQPVRGGRGARGAAAAAAQAQAQAQAAAAVPPPAAAGHILGVPAAQNNANQFGNLLQHRDGALQVDPHVLQQRANEMGVSVADLFNILFRG